MKNSEAYKFAQEIIVQSLEYPKPMPVKHACDMLERLLKHQHQGSSVDVSEQSIFIHGRI